MKPYQTCSSEINQRFCEIEVKKKTRCKELINELYGCWLADVLNLIHSPASISLFPGFSYTNQQHWSISVIEAKTSWQEGQWAYAKKLDMENWQFKLETILQIVL